MRILVTGGAGYIGSVTVSKLQKQGHEVTVLDNLSQGHKESVAAPLIVGDLLDREFLSKNVPLGFDAVIHFAALALAGESMENPYKYFQNNIMGGLNLLELMREKNIKNIIFSSTCAIYGTPKKVPISEDEEKKPESVYGESKLILEKMLEWYDVLYQIKSVKLRYFNAAGASLDSKLGEKHSPETHIIPLAINVALGRSEAFHLFGNDYPTPDGTCIRDYIHVEDLASAHILALEKLLSSQKSNNYNLGTGFGYSNMDVLRMVKKVSGKDFKIEIEKRRPGDPPQIFADNTKAMKELGFKPQYSDLETIVKTAWEWHKRQP